MLHLWLGKMPFQGLKAGVIMSIVRDGEVEFPADMDSNYKELIGGLIDSTAYKKMDSRGISKE
jgi:hypothetical protein